MSLVVGFPTTTPPASMTIAGRHLARSSRQIDAPLSCAAISRARWRRPGRWAWTTLALANRCFGKCLCPMQTGPFRAYPCRCGLCSSGFFGRSAIQRTPRSHSSKQGVEPACSERLAELASEHGTVLLVGHGSLNWFIARHLKKMGWSGPNKSPRKYWTFAVYSDLGALAAPDGTLSNFRSSQHAGS